MTRLTKKRAEGDTDRARASLKLNNPFRFTRQRLRGEAGQHALNLQAERVGASPGFIQEFREPPTYSRLARPIFAHPREACRLIGVSPRLPENDNTFSGFFAGLIHTVVKTFGAFAARRFNVNPSKTILTASPSGATVCGSSA